MLKSAIWWTTMACNFKCKYCWEVQAQERGEFKSVPFRPARDWLEVWNRCGHNSWTSPAASRS